MLHLVIFLRCLIHISYISRSMMLVSTIRQENKLLHIFHSKPTLFMSKADYQCENFQSISLLELKNSITSEQLSILQNMDKLLEATRKQSVASALKRFKFSILLSERKYEPETEIEAINISVIQDRIKSKASTLSFSGLTISLHSLYHIKVTILRKKISDRNLLSAVDTLCDYLLQNILSLLSSTSNETVLQIKPKYFSLFLYSLTSIKKLTPGKMNFEGFNSTAYNHILIRTFFAF